MLLQPLGVKVGTFRWLVSIQVFLRHHLFDLERSLTMARSFSTHEVGGISLEVTALTLGVRVLGSHESGLIFLPTTCVHVDAVFGLDRAFRCDFPIDTSLLFAKEGVGVLLEHGAVRLCFILISEERGRVPMVKLSICVSGDHLVLNVLELFSERVGRVDSLSVVGLTSAVEFGSIITVNRGAVRLGFTEELTVVGFEPNRLFNCRRDAVHSVRATCLVIT